MTDSEKLETLAKFQDIEDRSRLKAMIEELRNDISALKIQIQDIASNTSALQKDYSSLNDKINGEIKN
jgi:predicted  nucleic acid-binding Zn-ribbon protein